MKALYVAASGMNAQQTRIDTVADNLANSSTTGFKRSRAAFQDVFYQAVSATVPSRVGNGVRLSSVQRDHAQGMLTQTGDMLHVAVNGPGFLSVEDPSGEVLYTRDGALTRDADGILRTPSGLPLAGEIMVPLDASNIRIEQDGTVFAQLPGDTELTNLGQIELVRFENPTGLEPLGRNLFAPTADSGDPLTVAPGEGVEVIQGFLESSNVDVAQELIDLVMAQRVYELNSKVIQAADETLQVAASLRR